MDDKTLVSATETGKEEDGRGEKVEVEIAPLVDLTPTGLKRIYFDTKNKIHSVEVLKEMKDGTFICWDEDLQDLTPYSRAYYQVKFWGTEKEAAKCAIERMEKYIKECKEEIKLFSKLI